MDWWIQIWRVCQYSWEGYVRLDKRQLIRSLVDSDTYFMCVTTMDEVRLGKRSSWKWFSGSNILYLTLLWVRLCYPWFGVTVFDKMMVLWHISSTLLPISNMNYSKWYLLVTAPSNAMAATICSHINESNRIIPIFRTVYLQCALYQKCWKRYLTDGVQCSKWCQTLPLAVYRTLNFMLKIYVYITCGEIIWILIIQSLKMFLPFSSINPTFAVSCLLHIVNEASLNLKYEVPSMNLLFLFKDFKCLKRELLVQESSIFSLFGNK
jgi:hypothetical protein